METLPSVALMSLLSTMRLGDRLLLVCLGSIAAALQVRVHRLLRVIELFLAFHRLHQQKKHHLQLLLDRGYQEIVR